MFQIDRKAFGVFVAALRKEKGLTQKAVAQQLCVSDKAVSKWETGVSLPDTVLLIPLAKLLDVSVTELLMSERLPKEDALKPDQVEDLVKTAITYADDRPERAYHAKSKWFLLYGISLVICAIGTALNLAAARPGRKPLLTCAILCTVFGAYFCCFTWTKLPRFYDENRVNVFCDGPFSMSMPGLAFHNRNWPHILKAMRASLCLSMAALPIVNLLAGYTAAELWSRMGDYILLGAFLCGLFLPAYAAGKRYE